MTKVGMIMSVSAGAAVGMVMVVWGIADYMFRKGEFSF